MSYNKFLEQKCPKREKGIPALPQRAMLRLIPPPGAKELRAEVLPSIRQSLLRKIIPYMFSNIFLFLIIRKTLNLRTVEAYMLYALSFIFRVLFKS